MSKIDKKYESSFKIEVALEAVKESKTMEKLCQQYDVDENQISEWKKKLEENCDNFFEKKQKDHKTEIDRLNRVINQLTAECDFLKNVIKR